MFMQMDLLFKDLNMKFSAPVVYTISGWIEIEAADLAEAKKIAKEINETDGVEFSSIKDQTTDSEILVNEIQAIQLPTWTISPMNKIKIIKVYLYRQAVVRISFESPEWYDDEEAYFDSDIHLNLDRCVVPRFKVYALEDELVKLAGWYSRDNHTVFVYIDASGIERAVWFHDFKATFGYASDVVEMKNRGY